MAKPAISLDFSALEAETPVAVEAQPNGEPLELRLADIDPDPNQPRKVFTPEKMAELVASIKEHGVLSPISVRPNPEKPGRWLIVMGERRYRASVAVGNDTIRAILDEKATAYAQMVENLQREDLKPMEVAAFIQARKADGDKQADIARLLGVDRSFVTNHLALIDPPACIERAYNEGKSTSAKTLYELRTLHEKHPEAVDAWVDSIPEITRAAVKAFAQSLKEPKTTAAGEGTTPPGNGESVGHVQQTGTGDGQGQNAAKAGNEGGGAGKTNSAQTGDGDGDGENHNKRTSWPPGKVASDPDLIKRPLLVATVAGRTAIILLNRRPSDFGKVRVRFEDNGADEEVSIAECVLQQLSEEPK